MKLFKIKTGLKHPARKFLLSFLLSGITLGSFPIVSKSFVPYVYVPKPNSLKNTGINIGRTASQLIKLGKYEEAARLGELAVRVQPKDERLWSILAEAQLRSKDFKKAAESLAKAKKLNPRNASLWFAEATLAMKQKQIKNAISLIDAGLNLDPQNAEAYFQLGNARILEAKLILAKKAFKEASKIDPSFWAAINNEALVEFELGEINKAIENWKKVLSIKKNAEPMLALASAINEQDPGNKEAIQLALQALAEDPNYVSPLHQEEQLWGPMLRKATNRLLTNPKLASAVERAIANSDANPEL